jgi:hypothetical protein
MPATTKNIPPVLFRCWSPKSAGGLKSGKLHDGVARHSFTEVGLLGEFQQHKNLYGRIPTAFVSATPNFLRTLHFAYQKIHDGEDTRDIKIAFLTSRTDTQTIIYPAKNFAIESGSSEEEADNFANEYLFLWNVPDDNVIHVVSMDLVIRRGFTLPEIRTGQPFPSLSDLRRAIVDHRDQLAPFERGYVCGSDACMFGLRAPVREIALQMSRWARSWIHNPTSWGIVDQTIEEAIQDRITTVAEDLDDQGELKYLMFDLSCLEDTHNETILEIGWRLQNYHYTEILQARLESAELEIENHRQESADQIETVYQRVGL